VYQLFITINTTITINKESDDAVAAFAPPTSDDSESAICNGVRKDPFVIKDAAVAYAENEFENKSNAEPKKEGNKTGIPTLNQYSIEFPPKASEASRHSDLIFSNEGKKTKTINGIWKRV
jgi:hypothetical protein